MRYTDRANSALLSDPHEVCRALEEPELKAAAGTDPQFGELRTQATKARAQMLTRLAAAG